MAAAKMRQGKRWGEGAASVSQKLSFLVSLPVSTCAGVTANVGSRPIAHSNLVSADCATFGQLVGPSCIALAGDEARR